jgi:hypothetical protein
MAASAADLDRQLGLSGRLMTAMEFEGRQQPPALYPYLLQDMSQAVGRARKQLPSPADRRSCAFAALLLFLLLWPLPQALQLPAGLRQLLPSSGINRQQESRQDAGASAPSQSDQPQSGQGQRQQPQSSSGGEPQQDDGAASGQQRSDNRQQQSGAQQQRPGEEPSDQPGGRNQQQQSGDGQQPMQADRQQGQGQETGGEQGNAPKAGQMQVDDSAASAELKADIKEMLRELQAEMQQMQDQLHQQQDIPAVIPGGQRTSDDLYAQPEAIDPVAQGDAAIQLRADTEASDAARPATGSGSGAAIGDDISDDAPKLQAEDAALSDESGTESGASRQRIPPEYRPVFERLSPSTSSAPSAPSSPPAPAQPPEPAP